MDKLEIMKNFAEKNNVPIMLDGGIEFLCEYVEKNEIREILECGTAIGYSSIKMASIHQNIMIDTCEIKEELVNTARQNIQECELENQITVHHLDALDFKTEKIYDLIFIDAAKAQYKKYMEYFRKNLASGGTFVFDNLEFHGLVDHPERAKSRNTKQLVRKIKEFRDYLKNEQSLLTTYYPNIGDGVAIVKLKKSN